jgi:hypothetical protein
MKDGVGVVQFGTNDCTAEGFCYVLSKSWPYVTERAPVLKESTAYCVDMILEKKLVVKGCSKNHPYILMIADFYSFAVAVWPQTPAVRQLERDPG